MKVKEMFLTFVMRIDVTQANANSDVREKNPILWFIHSATKTAMRIIKCQLSRRTWMHLISWYNMINV